MPAACTQCGHGYETGGPCPRCGGQSGPSGTGPRWLHTVAGRLMIGLIVSQGLFYALERLLTGLLLAIQGGQAQEVWLVPGNLICLQIAQLFAVLIGGTLAGGGQTGALSLGAIVGAWNGVVSILLRQIPPDQISSLALYTSPLVHAFIATLGAGIGAQIWRPVSESNFGPMASTTKKKLKPSRPWFEGKIAWFRVIVGTTLAILGTLYAPDVFKKLLEWSGGKLGTESAFQDRLIIWEIRGMALLLAGFLAGMMTTNGLKQGLVVAIMACTILVGIQTNRRGDLVEAAAIILVSTFSMSMLGGWFGGALFPPISTYNPRRAAAAAQA